VCLFSFACSRQHRTASADYSITGLAGDTEQYPLVQPIAGILSLEMHPAFDPVLNVQVSQFAHGYALLECVGLIWAEKLLQILYLLARLFDQ
jgi:hypothetical protein